MVRHTLIALLLVGVTVAVYAPLRQAPFVYEDEHFRASPALTFDVPSRVLSIWAAQQTPDPGVAHLVNLALHLVVGALVAAIAGTLAGPAAALGATLVHLWHPLNSQAVAYVNGRSDLLLTLGIALAVWAALRRGLWRWHVVAIGLLVAMTSKEIGVVGIPLVVLTLLVWRREESQVAPGVLWVGVGAVLGAAWTSVSGWLAMAPGAGGPDVVWAEFTVRQLGLAWALLTRFVWPVGFSIDHDALTLSAAALSLALVATGGVIALIATTWRRRPLLAWSLAWVAVALAPRLLVGTNEFLAERHLYLPLVGLSVVTGTGVARWLTAPLADGPFWLTYRAQFRAAFHV